LLASVTGDQFYPVVVSDGAGGAIVAWNDQRGTSADVYAQHVLANGALDAAWPAAGRAVVSNTDNQWYPSIVSDGAGGALVTWQDEHFPTNIRIFAHHLQANGTLDAAWPAAGCVICAAGDLREHARLVPDGSGGAIVAWQDGRGGANYDIYAHHLRSTGTVDPGWPADGRAVCDTVSDQLTPTIASDGAGGAIVAWEDYRSGAGADIFAQRVRASGVLDPGWARQGAALCTAAGYQVQPVLAGDGFGNTIAVWEDHRDGAGTDIYAARVTAGGMVDPAWTANGVGVCTESHDQFSPTAVPDGTGGVVVCWADTRGAGGSYDVYAQRVTAGGLIGGSVVDVPHASRAATGLALACPNPVRGTAFTVSVTLANDAGARLELLDLTGRRIASRELGGLGAGGHALDFDAGMALPTGVYFLRLSQGGGEVGRRVAIIQ